MEQPTSDCRYFTSYSGVELPLRLINPLPDIDNRNTYFCGYFDAVGRLLLCQKMVYGEVELQHRYRYDNSGVLRQAEITDADGEVNVLEFDAEGKLCRAY